MIKSSNFFIALLALTLSIPILCMENHPQQSFIDALLINHPTAAPLIRAAVKGDTREVAELLDAGANPNIEYQKSSTPLKWAATFGHFEVCNILLAYGADINYMVKPPHMSGSTPLMFVAEAGQTESCRFLIKNKADVLMKNEHGLTALYAAQNTEESDTCKLLINAMLRPTNKEKEKVYFILTFLNKKYPLAKDTNKLIVIDLLYGYMQLKKPMVIAEIKKINRPAGLIDYVNRK